MLHTEDFNRMNDLLILQVRLLGQLTNDRPAVATYKVADTSGYLLYTKFKTTVLIGECLAVSQTVFKKNDQEEKKKKKSAKKKHAWPAAR